MLRSLLISACLMALSPAAFSQAENWDVYLAKYEKGPGSTILDLSFKSKAPIAAYPFLLITGVDITRCNTDGLPEQDAFQALYGLSDKLQTLIDKNYPNKMVGSFTYQCNRSDYYYLRDTINLRERLDSFYRKDYPTVKWVIKIQADAQWGAYLTFLYPNEETLEYMSNQKVLRKLTDAGDDLTKARKVDHWIYFSNAADRDKFALSITKQHYKIESKEFVKEIKQPYKLRISRTDKVDLESITKITLELRKEASKFNGNYDGWETAVELNNK